MPTVELPAGTIQYQDTGGDSVVVLRHGLAMDGSRQRHVVRALHVDHRLVVPTLPLGDHHHPMAAGADLPPRGIAALQAEFLDALDLREVTLVRKDSGLFQLAAAQHLERLARPAVTSCEAFDNFPPGLPGCAVSLAGRLPGGLNALVQPLRVRGLRRLPMALGWMAMRPIPHAVTDARLRPLLGQSQVRRDLIKYLRGAADDPDVMLAAAEGLRSFARPALVVWAADDRAMPPKHGRLLEIADSYTLIPEDQPGPPVRAIHQFIHRTQAHR
jgi:pimeloyl-ACP methyl ester carboxylesterase